METNPDYIIIGGGLAGTITALTLLEYRQKPLLIDITDNTSSSRVAAGLFNPVTGKKSVLTWQAELLFSYLHQFYPRWEKELKQSFFHPLPIYKPFKTVEETNDLYGKSANPDYQPFVEKTFSEPVNTACIHNPLGGIMFSRGGYVDVNQFLAAAHEMLKKNNFLLREKFQPDLLNLGYDKVAYQGFTAKGIIFCEGTAVASNKYFDWLPMDPVKGELLKIAVQQDCELDFVINRDLFLIPKNNRQFISGATYDKSRLDALPTSEARKQISDKLERFFMPAYSVAEQWAGVRPATRDRRPFVGIHPVHKPLAILNGLGTKGVSLAPFFARQLVEQLLFDKEIDREVNISRYFQLL